MWNRKSFTAPPQCSLPAQLTINKKGTLGRAKKSLTKGETVFHKHGKALNAEKVVLHKMIYRLHNQFRSEKTMKGLKMVKSCLKRYDDAKMINVFKGIPELINLGDSTGDKVYLGSRQLLEYHLVRIQGVGALLRQCLNYSRYTFFHSRQHLNIGNLIPQNMIILGLTSRLWVIVKSLLQHLIDLYKQVYSCRIILSPTQVPWLPEGEVLPKDLTAWLDLNFPARLVTSVDMGEALDDGAAFENEENMDIENAALANLPDIATEDLGEPVKRKLPPKEETLSVPRKKQKIEDSKIDMTEQDHRPPAQRKLVDNFRAEVTKFPKTKIFTMVKKFKCLAKSDPDLFSGGRKELKNRKAKINSLVQAYREKKSGCSKSLKGDETFTEVKELILGVLPPLEQTLSGCDDECINGTSETLQAWDDDMDRPPTQAVAEVKEYFESKLNNLRDFVNLREQIYLKKKFIIGSHKITLSKENVLLLRKILKKFSVPRDLGSEDSIQKLTGLSRLRDDLVDIFSSIVNQYIRTNSTVPVSHRKPSRLAKGKKDRKRKRQL